LSYPNYQERAAEFSVGDRVFPFYTDAYHAGTVVAVWPAIGMVDVSFPHGTARMGVEELQRGERGDEAVPPSPENETVPGGVGMVPVSAGPNATRVARTFVQQSLQKNALYWAAVDRKYRASRSELDSGKYGCPKCKAAALRRAVYKRRDGSSEKLYGCPSCLFLVKRCDIIGDSHHAPAGV